MNIDVAVIGAGHNGLVAATYLARAGLSVCLFERRSFPGGATLTEELWPGYRFSTGAHQIHALPPKIARELGLFEEGFELVPREGMLRPRLDGTYDGDIDLELRNNRMARSRLTREELAGRQAYLDFQAKLYRILAPYTLTVPPTLDELRRRAAGTPDEEILRLVATKTLWELQDLYLPTERLRDYFAIEAAAVALNPNAFALARGVLGEPLAGTSEAPLNGYVRGGMGNLAAILAKVARQAGASLELGRPVDQILVRNRRAVGLRLADGAEVRAEAVLSCADTKTTFLRLLSPEDVEPPLRQKVESLVTHVSCYKFLAAISELPRWSAWDGDPDYPSAGGVQLEVSREGVRQIYQDLEAGLPPRRPIISLGIPSMRDSSLAPAGHHTASLYISPAPRNLRRGSWDSARTEVAEALIDQITEYAPNFRRSILHYKLRTPLDIEREQGMTDGCIWHIQHTAEQLYGSRPLPELAAYRTPIDRFYLGGAGQHPGGEVSGIPGRNAAHEILADLGVASSP